MDVDDHLYITACQARRYSLSSIGASRDRGLVAYSDIVWFPSGMHFQLGTEPRILLYEMDDCGQCLYNQYVKRIMGVLRKFVCKSCKRESICIAGNVTLMDVYNHLYIVRRRRYSLSPI